jgi:response regulator RpfG family c-di-GMP phosphodiesterase
VKILFVDDEPHFLAGLCRMLRSESHEWEAEFVTSVDAALETVAGTRFDTVVSDVNMPGKSGFDLLAAMQQDPRTKNIPIIILTGNAESDLKRRALDLGATDLLNKPVQLEDLLARLRSVLRLKQYQDQLENQNQILEEKVRERTRELEYSRQDIIWRLAKAGEFRDPETGEHVMRVALCSRLLAQAAGLDGALTRQIFLTSPLHDIGKIGVPDEILRKQGSLPPAEMELMRRHCEIGEAILLEHPRGMKTMLESLLGTAPDGLLPDADIMRVTAAEIAGGHHEKWDGSGYPRKLQGAAIPVPARIVAIADVFDALRSELPYKRPFDAERSVSIIAEAGGTHFDPELVEAFQTLVNQFEEVRAAFGENRQ